MIKVVSGIRRCGKSTLLQQYQEYLINSGISKQQIIFIKFEDLDLKDNYPKTVLTLDRLSLGNYNGIMVKNVLDWLVSCVFMDKNCAYGDSIIINLI